MKQSSNHFQGHEDNYNSKATMVNSLVNRATKTDFQNSHFWGEDQSEQRTGQGIYNVCHRMVPYQEIHLHHYPPSENYFDIFEKERCIAHAPPPNKTGYTTAYNDLTLINHVSCKHETQLYDQRVEEKSRQTIKLRSSQFWREKSFESYEPRASQTNDTCPTLKRKFLINRISSDSQRPEIIRRPANILITGSNATYLSQAQSQMFLSIDLRIDKGPLDGILVHPWSDQEVLEGRRIMRIQRFQQGCTLHAHFSAAQPTQNLIRTSTPKNPNCLEVSCIRYDHTDGVKTKFFITSVEVIEIVEFLIGKNSVNSILKWKERGRIRSNLASLWFKSWCDLGPIQLRFESQIRRYNSRNPNTTTKYMRVLQWVNLEYALRKALLFYCVHVPG